MRSGVGYDVHAFVIGEILVLGGVQIEHDKGLVGHSDGDALIHAIIAVSYTHLRAHET